MSTSAQSTPVTSGQLEHWSVDDASRAFEGLLSAPERDTESPEKRQPEPSTPEAQDEPKASTKQAPAAPEPETASDEGSESADEDAQETAEDTQAVATQPETYTVKVDGKDVTVTRDELLNGYSRTQDYTRKTMQLAEQRKQWEQQEVAAVKQERGQYAKVIGELRQFLETQAQEPDWAMLRATLPLDEYVTQKDKWDADQKRLSQVKAEEARITAQRQQDAAEGFRSYVQAERQKLIEVDPVFADPTQGRALQDELSAFALSKGFTPEEVNQVTDHRLVLILRDAMRYQQQQAKAPKIQNKIDAAPVTVAPGASGATKPKPNKAQRDFARLRETGKVDDAARLLESLID